MDQLWMPHVGLLLLIKLIHENHERSMAGFMSNVGQSHSLNTKFIIVLEGLKIAVDMGI